MVTVTGRVVRGRVVVKGRKLPEGARVTVVYDDADDAVFRLTEQDYVALRKAEREIEQGKSYSGVEVLEGLKRRASKKRRK